MLHKSRKWTAKNDVESESDLFTYLNEKIKRLDNQDLGLWSLLTDLKKYFEDNNRLHNELQSKIAKNADLQTSISDIQVFLIREREENLRLATENDLLRIRDLENNCSIEILLQLAGINRDQLRQIISTEPTRKRRGSGKENCHHANNEKNSHEGMSRDALILQVTSLKTQLDNLKTLFRNEVDVLLKDREVIAEERTAVVNSLKKESASLSQLLHEAQAALAETAELLLNEQKQRRDEAADYLEDRISAENKLDAATRLLSDSTYFQSNGVRKSKSMIFSERTLSHASHREDLTTYYRQQAKRFEAESKTWKAKAETTEKVLKERIQRLASELSLARNRYDDLDQRRRLEAEGFRSDIKLLRDKLLELEKKFNKVKNEHDASCPLFKPDDVGLSTRSTFLKAKQLEKELSALKLKVAALTNPFS